MQTLRGLAPVLAQLLAVASLGVAGYRSSVRRREDAGVRSRALLLLPWALLAGGCGTKEGVTGPARAVTIAAASDLQFAFEDIQAEFGKSHPEIRLEVTYGSSGNLYAQLRNQAPFDLFLSADLEYPRRLAQEGLALPESEFPYAVGRIVLWTPANSPIDVEAQGINALRHAAVTHIAIANPQYAPYGRAAEAAMKAMGVYDTVKSKLVFGENVAQTLQFVQSGNAEIGIVSLSLAVSPAVRGKGRYWEVPPDKYPRIEQGGAILKWARDAEAARTVRAFLMQDRGRAVLKQHGLLLPEE